MVDGMYVFHIVLTINSHSFAMYHSSVSLSNGITLFCVGT
jgi:hypothetical protein